MVSTTQETPSVARSHESSSVVESFALIEAAHEHGVMHQGNGLSAHHDRSQLDGDAAGMTFAVA